MLQPPRHHYDCHAVRWLPDRGRAREQGGCRPNAAPCRSPPPGSGGHQRRWRRSGGLQSMRWAVLVPCQRLGRPQGCRGFERPGWARARRPPARLHRAPACCPTRLDPAGPPASGPPRPSAPPRTFMHPGAMRAHPAPQRAHRTAEGEGERRTLWQGEGAKGAADGPALPAVQAPWGAGAGCRRCMITPGAKTQRCGRPGARRAPGQPPPPPPPPLRRSPAPRRWGGT